DLDLIVNNINDPVSVYRNDVKKGNSVQFHFEGIGKNTAAIGTQVTVYIDSTTLYQEQSPVKGYLSSVDPRLHFGLGKTEKIDSVVFRWSDGTYSKLINPQINTIITVKEANQEKYNVEKTTNTITYLEELEDTELFRYDHIENSFIDFNRDRLAFEMMSAEGPFTALGDVNGDNLTDIFIGGAKDQPGKMMLQQEGGRFISINNQLLEKDKKYEDSQSVFFDAEGDGDMDLYVGSGSIEYPRSSMWYTDRLYLNDGNGNFSKANDLLPKSMTQSTSFVRSLDYDQDGDYDLLLGTRAVSSQYGLPSPIYLLENNGEGKFTMVDGDKSNALQDIGMTKDAAIADLDGDGDQDFVIAGEWLPLTIFENEGGIFRKTEIDNTSGLWNAVIVRDINGDKLPDIVAGNQGLNTRFKASPEQPLRLYVNDFDNNGSVEQLITQYEGEQAYPISMLQDLMKQMPSLRKKLPTYQSYSRQSIEQLFDQNVLQRSIVHKVETLETALLLNKGQLTFVQAELPVQVQYSQVHAINVADVDQDGHEDLIVGGNLMRAKPEWGIYHASRGQVFTGDGKGNFSYVPEKKSGLGMDGEIRKIDQVVIDNKEHLLIWRNSKSVKKYRIND
ncbi:MAG: FG-GAP-like repeat-containing protein, partial [Cyclobacteriaceae bacterium]